MKLSLAKEIHRPLREGGSGDWSIWVGGGIIIEGSIDTRRKKPIRGIWALGVGNHIPGPSSYEDRYEYGRPEHSEGG